MRPQRLSLVGVPIRLFRPLLLARLSGAPLGTRKPDVAARSARMRLLQSVPDPYDGLSKSVDLARTVRVPRLPVRDTFDPAFPVRSEDLPVSTGPPFPPSGPKTFRFPRSCAANLNSSSGV
jgi:hypothetical protein